MRSPAFQFYPDDFIGGTVGLTVKEVGAYIRLLCFQWGNGSIPPRAIDGKNIAINRIAGCEVSEAVLYKFPDGKNERLESERAKQAVWREKSRVGGVHSAAVRKSRVVEPPLNHPSNQTPTIITLQPNGNTPSPSPSPSPSLIPLPLLEKGVVDKKEWKPTTEQIRLSALFHRKPVTPWSKKEISAWRVITPIPEDDMARLEKFYLKTDHPKDADYRKRKLITLLNDFNGAMDMARRPIRPDLNL